MVRTYLNSARAVVPPPRLRAKCVVFLHSLQLLRRGPGRACARIAGGEKACESPQGWTVLRRLLELSAGWILRGGSGKGLVFEMAVCEQLKRPYLLGLGANFGGLVMVRSEVINF